MSKEFKTIQELWSHCLFCPICREFSCIINITAGPDDEFQITDYQKIGSELKLYCRFYPNSKKKRKSEYSSIFTINCDTNAFTLNVGGPVPEIVSRIEKSYFYCYFNSECAKCDNIYLNTVDLEFDNSKKQIFNLKMDREGFYLLTEKDKFHIALLHEYQKMIISRCEFSSGGAVVDSEKVINLPMVNLDFSNVPKVINKIKTLILFS